ncbi:hypothetical protein EPI10_013029 [Gossypium australe]|uniref:Uncharacterized protein n=1 Tax=Gossypium australe TaxID=47621 RepID=A0A5B6UQQ4_9ROSI|nr:hypothetical protein EPI10_013029 [Gossypium australe]
MAQSAVQKMRHCFGAREIKTRELLTENSPDCSPLQAIRSTCGSDTKRIRRIRSATASGKILFQMYEQEFPSRASRKLFFGKYLSLKTCATSICTKTSTGTNGYLVYPLPSPHQKLANLHSIFSHRTLENRKHDIAYVGIACKTDLMKISLPSCDNSLEFQASIRTAILSTKF